MRERVQGVGCTISGCKSDVALTHSTHSHTHTLTHSHTHTLTHTQTHTHTHSHTHTHTRTQVIDAIKFNAGKMIQTMMLGVLVNPKP